MYLGTPSTPAIRHAMTKRDDLGAMVTVSQGNRIPEGVPVGIDNECFLHPERFGNGDAFLQLIAQFDPDDVLFATAPDIVGDWAATLQRSRPWLDRIRTAGVPAAIVIQNDATRLTVPWDDVDAVFIGGTTDWKLGPRVVEIPAEANDRDISVHMGRVNSHKRLAYAAWIGCDTADGTFLAFGPDQNLPKLLRWLDDVNTQPSLFTPLPSRWWT